MSLMLRSLAERAPLRNPPHELLCSYRSSAGWCTAFASSTPHASTAQQAGRQSTDQWLAFRRTCANPRVPRRNDTHVVWKGGGSARAHISHTLAAVSVPPPNAGREDGKAAPHGRARSRWGRVRSRAGPPATPSSPVVTTTAPTRHPRRRVGAPSLAMLKGQARNLENTFPSPRTPNGGFLKMQECMEGDREG